MTVHISIKFEKTSVLNTSVCSIPLYYECTSWWCLSWWLSITRVFFRRST